MGLCYRTTRWLDILWGQHLELSPPARELVQIGIRKQGNSFVGFPADLHARLYLSSDPPDIDNAPEWATRLHDLATELGEWQRLRLMCARNGFTAGIATEAMLEQLLPHVPERPPVQPDQELPSAPDTHQEPAGDPQGAGDSPRQDGGQKGLQNGSQDLRNAQQNRLVDADLRAALRQAIRSARNAVQQAEAELEGLATPLNMGSPGTAVVMQTGPADLKQIRDVHSRLSSSHRLRRICELAGRLERLAVAKVRSKVKPGVGEIHGIGLGGLPDLARLLPSELVAFRRRPLRLHLLSRLLQNQALIYAMTGREPQSKGPIVVLLDESGSMRESGKDIWSKAVALALLSTATRQKRAWHLVAFNGAITREVEIPAGKATANDIQQALNHGCSGGTDFDAPVVRAVNIIKTSPTMKQADVVIITDGEDGLEQATIDQARELTQKEGVSWFAVGVGPDADVGLQSLAPIATSMVRVRDTDDPEPIIPIINLEQAA